MDIDALIVRYSSEPAFRNPMSFIGNFRRALNAAHQDFEKIIDVEAVLVGFVISVVPPEQVSEVRAEYAAMCMKIQVPAVKEMCLGLLEMLLLEKQEQLIMQQFDAQNILLNAAICNKCNKTFNKPRIFTGDE